MKLEVSTSFRRLVLLTIVFIYLVILAGGIVRSTGSGMGCPDWPKCFGKWVPPTHISQLPVNYKEKFKVGHRIIADFNAFKTWIEYTNRLLGVIVGLLVVAVFICSIPYFGQNKELVYLTLAVVLLTGLQGWIGAKVVSSHLAQHMVTIHMLIALVILALAMIVYKNISIDHTLTGGLKGNWLLYLSLLTLVQILVGTQIRQEIDTIAIKHNDLLREVWIDELSIKFTWHRVLAVIVVIMNAVYSFFVIRNLGWNAIASKLLVVILCVFALEYLSGVGMIRFDIPFFIQPVHLLLASLVFGLQFYVWLLSRSSQKQQLDFHTSLATSDVK